jgi:hypothetical protein
MIIIASDWPKLPHRPIPAKTLVLSPGKLLLLHVTLC